MTALVDHQIRRRIEEGYIRIDPFDDSLINPASLDVRLGGNFTEVEPQRGHFHDGPGIVNPLDKGTIRNKEIKGREYHLHPGRMVLASLLEDVTLPNDICARVVGKSSLGRLGLDNSSCAGFVDPGWSGILTIELFNHSSNVIVLTVGMKIGQLLFEETLPCSKPYSQTGRYYKQSAGQGSHGI